LESSDNNGPYLSEERGMCLSLKVANEHRVVLKVIVSKEFRDLPLAFMKFLLCLGDINISILKRVHFDINVDMIKVVFKSLEERWNLGLLIKGDRVDILLWG
jgi:hypothetical protein